MPSLLVWNLCRIHGSTCGGQVNFKHSIFEFDYLKNEVMMLCSFFEWKNTKLGVYIEIVVGHLEFLFK